MKNVNVDKIIKNVNEAIKNKNYVKMMDIKDVIDDAVEEDKFKAWIYDDEEGKVNLRINKDFQQIELNEEECKELFNQLKYADDFNWKIPF